MNHKISHISLTGFIVFIALFHFGFKEHRAPADVYLAPAATIQNSPYFQEASRLKDRNPADPQSTFQFERVKIQYLIDRIRQSAITFIRNGEAHSAREAAQHIAMKFRVRGEKIGNARDFIKYFATRSSSTGKLYMAQFDDGKTYPAGDILYNELASLEVRLSQDSFSA